jgi:hypothetical protein
MRQLEMRWEDLTFWEQTFWGIALVFTVLSLLQLVMGGFGIALEEKAAAESTTRKEWWSTRNAIFFFAFVGWVGVWTYHRIDTLPLQLLVIAIAGTIGMWITAYVDRLILNRSSLNNFDTNQLLFKTAQVQQTIPSHQSGYGHIIYTTDKKNILLTAITNHLTSIASGSSVRIVEVVEDDLVLVEPTVE